MKKSIAAAVVLGSLFAISVSAYPNSATVTTLVGSLAGFFLSSRSAEKRIEPPQLTVGPQASIAVLGVPVTENFNSLALSGTSSTVPTGWAFSEAGTGASTTYTAGTGSSTTGDTYSFGTAASTDRAFGGLQSGTLNPTIGSSFTNDTGSVIGSLDISFFGEQWRIGNNGAARDDRIDFQYSLDATSLTTGTWNDVNTLDFTNPIKTAAAASAV